MSSQKTSSLSFPKGGKNKITLTNTTRYFWDKFIRRGQICESNQVKNSVLRNDTLLSITKMTRMCHINEICTWFSLPF